MKHNHRTTDNNLTFPQWSWFDIVLITLGCGFFLYLGIVLILYLRGMDESVKTLSEITSTSLTLQLGLVEIIALSLSVYILGMRRHHYDWKAIGFRPIPRNWVFGAIIISFIAIPLTGLIALFVQLTFGLPLENPQLDFLLPKDLTPFGGVAILFLGGITIPFVEELYFRGVLYPWFSNRVGVWLRAFINGLGFGFVHLNLAIGSAAFVLGVILALSYEYSKTLWVPYLIHMINNSTKIVLLYLLLNLGVV